MHATSHLPQWARRCWSKRTSCIIRWNFHNEVGGLQFCARVAVNIKMMSSCSDLGGKTLICDFGMFRTITGGQQRNTIPTHMTCALIRNTHTHSYSSHSTLIRPRCGLYHRRSENLDRRHSAAVFAALLSKKTCQFC